MPHLCDAAHCSGCGACAAVCPVDALTLEQDASGFYRPVATDRCTQCGLCERTCPVLHPVARPDPVFPKSFVFKIADPSLLQKSASGGAFGCLARWALAQGGCVYGAVWDSSHHLQLARAETTEELLPMYGSKYVYSHAVNAYPDAKAALQQGRIVLFSGLPCQVAALYAYLGKSYANLYTAELLCHGAGSEKVFDQCCAFMESHQGKSLRFVEHSRKDQPWNSLIRRSATYHWDDGSTSGSDYLYDPYLILYMKALCYNEACFQCPFVHFPRYADFTLGDLTLYNAERSCTTPAQGGVGAVFCNTQKALRLQAELQTSPDALWEERPLAEILLHAKNYWSHTPKPGAYRQFWQELSEISAVEYVQRHFLGRAGYRLIAWAKRFLLALAGPENIARIQFIKSVGRKDHRKEADNFVTEIEKTLSEHS